MGSFGERRRLIGPLVKREPGNMGGILQRIEPREYRLFAGVIDGRQWPFIARLFFHASGGRLGDNRDWPEIEAGVDSIAGALADR